MIPNVCLNDRFVIFASIHGHDCSDEQVFLSFLVPGGAELRRDPKVLLCSLSVIAGHAVLLFMSLTLRRFHKYRELAPCSEHPAPPTSCSGAYRREQYPCVPLTLACALLQGWKMCSWGVPHPYSAHI